MANLYKKVAFKIEAPTAREVLVVGSFTEWTENPIDLNRKDNGVWEKMIRIKPGRYEYRYLIDGQWITDQTAHEFAKNEFGEINSVLRVE